MTEIRGILFDKDGTLFDFHATWSAWARNLLQDLSGGMPGLAADLGEAVGYDLPTATFAPDSPIIAATPDEIAQRLLPHLPGTNPVTLVARMNAMAALTPMVQAVPLVPLLDTLRGRGLKIGLATNDAEAAARTHLTTVGVLKHFDFVAGYDSGYGGKPAPGMMLGFAEAVGLRPAQVLMVGDSRHDLVAGRAAGMPCVAVLTGLAGEDELAPLADAVLRDIGDLPRWIARRNPATAPA